VHVAADSRSVIESCDVRLAVAGSAVCRCWIGRGVCDRLIVGCWRLFVIASCHVWCGIYVCFISRGRLDLQIPTMRCSLLCSKMHPTTLCASVQNVATYSSCVDNVQSSESVFTCCPSSLFKIVEPSSDMEVLSKTLEPRIMSSFFLETSPPGIQTQKTLRI
jgi:hypothetical protein